jgi:hypothetical protein
MTIIRILSIGIVAMLAMAIGIAAVGPVHAGGTKTQTSKVTPSRAAAPPKNPSGKDPITVHHFSLDAQGPSTSPGHGRDLK